jgi:hypothetical protein
MDSSSLQEKVLTVAKWSHRTACYAIHIGPHHRAGRRNWPHCNACMWHAAIHAAPLFMPAYLKKILSTESITVHLPTSAGVVVDVDDQYITISV